MAHDIAAARTQTNSAQGNAPFLSMSEGRTAIDRPRPRHRQDDQCREPRRLSGRQPVSVLLRSVGKHIGTSSWQIEGLNLLLIVVSCVLAHLYPYALLIMSYAVLGPAHYLTQISWLHDRKYFASSGKVLPVMGVLSVVLVMPLFGLRVAQPWFGASVVGVAIAVAVAATVPGSRGLAAGTIVSAGLLWAVARWWPVAMGLAMLVPTVLHVFVFTLSFMLLGGLRSKSRLASASVLVMVLCTLSFWWSGVHDASDGAGVAERFFEPVVDAMKQFGIPSSSVRIFGFLSFAYTYHYLNWAIKAPVIRWHNVPRARMIAIVAAYGVVLAVYALSFTAGVLVSLVLSYLHVFLEFPLNMRTFAALGRAAFVESPQTASPKGNVP